MRSKHKTGLSFVGLHYMKQRTMGTFFFYSQLVYSYIKCKYATRYANSTDIAEGKSRYPCVFPALGHPLLALAAGHTGPHSSDRLTLDQNRHDLEYAPSTSHLWSRRLVLFHKPGYIYIALSFSFPTLLQDQKAKEKHIPAPLSPFPSKFFKERRDICHTAAQAVGD